MIVVERQVPHSGLAVAEMDEMNEADTCQLVKGSVDGGGVDLAGGLRYTLRDHRRAHERFIAGGQDTTDRSPRKRQAQAGPLDTLREQIFGNDEIAGHRDHPTGTLIRRAVDDERGRNESKHRWVPSPLRATNGTTTLRNGPERSTEATIGGRAAALAKPNDPGLPTPEASPNGESHCDGPYRFDLPTHARTSQPDQARAHTAGQRFLATRE